MMHARARTHHPLYHKTCCGFYCLYTLDTHSHFSIHLVYTKHSSHRASSVNHTSSKKEAILPILLLLKPSIPGLMFRCFSGIRGAGFPNDKSWGHVVNGIVLFVCACVCVCVRFIRIIRWAQPQCSCFSRIYSTKQFSTVLLAVILHFLRFLMGSEL